MQRAMCQVLSFHSKWNKKLNPGMYCKLLVGRRHVHRVYYSILDNVCHSHARKLPNRHGAYCEPYIRSVQKIPNYEAVSTNTVSSEW
jgi:hypothetical protein